MGTAITYKCEVCGKDFESHRVRKGKLVCGPCAGDLRKKGQGSVQLKKNGGTEKTEDDKPSSRATAGATVNAKAVPAATVPAEKGGGGMSLADLAKQLREKYQKQNGGQTIGEQLKREE